MNLCAQCSLPLSLPQQLCPHHAIAADDWSAANKIMCDFLHRGRVPLRNETERSDDFWALDV